MKFRYIGDPNVQTPEGINHGPLFNRSYGYEWKKFETIVDIPDDALICDKAGAPAYPHMLICKKLLNNPHFELVEEKQMDFEDEPVKPKRKYTRRKKVVTDEPSTIEPATEGSAAA